MRWILFAILVYVATVVQATTAQLVVVHMPQGDVVPDLLAVVAVFFVLHLRNERDAILAAWCLGLAIDLTTTGGTAAGSVVGPMPLAYALAAMIVFRMRDAFFSQRTGSQMLLGAIFVLLAHPVWVAMQSILAWSAATWSDYWRMSLQAVMMAAFTALVAPPVLRVLGRVERWFISPPAGRRGR